MNLSRRHLLQIAGASGFAWLTPLAETLAWNEHLTGAANSQAKSLILLWMAGGPSQLETFDPHPDTNISAGTKAIATSVSDIQLAAGMEQTAEVMQHLMLVRSVVSKEGDHERASYHVKTGFRPVPALIHPAIGAVLCHQLPIGNTEIPRHISILPGGSPGRGGYLGDQFDAFQAGDPRDPLPDMQPAVETKRFQQRLQDLAVIDRQFAAGRLSDMERERTLHRTVLSQATQMMDSEQLAAFDLSNVAKAEINAFGDSAFGRGCLAAARLIETGVRCVEVTLSGWDTHVTNHEFHDERKRELDPALAALIRYLHQRGRLEDTVVMCAGEFGRTPQVNRVGGRDHWPHGFSIALAGGGIPGGKVLGETDPDGNAIPYDSGIPVADVHASVLDRFGVNFRQELPTPIGRPMKVSEGNVVF
jgi:uncharacterized protein (DUF1501 family)